MSDEIDIKTKSKKTKRLLILSVVVIVLLTLGVLWKVTSKGVTAKKVERQLSLGENYLSELDYEQAIAAYELAIEIDPKCTEAYLGLAEVYEEMGEYEEAEEILEEARDKITKEEDVDRIKRKEKKVEKKIEKKKEEESEETKVSEVTIAPTPGLTPIVTPESIVTPPDGLSEEGKGIRKVAVGEYVTFGSYEQDNNLTNGAEEIEWLVLDVQDGRALLLSKYGLDTQPYNEEYENVTWETCTLRKWLNTSFYDNAFKTDEKESIIQSVIVNDDNPTYKTEGGNDTSDNIFLLSIEESKEYFPEDKVYSYGRKENPERATTPTDYAVSKGGYVTVHGEWDDGNCYWWLRSPGGEEFLAASVNSDGRVYDGHIQDDGNHVYSSFYTVRPALWVKMKSNDSGIDVTIKQENIPGINVEDTMVGEYVTFGTYEQDNNSENGPEAIRWLVLDKKDGKALLLSEYALDAKAYHEEYEAVTWETCTLRKWLNEEFYFRAFAETERQAVVESLIVNRDNAGYGVDGGNDTVDKVFLLSLDEISTYFTAPYEMYDSSRSVKVTDYAKAQGALVYEEFEIEFYANGWWWLRSPGCEPYQAARVLCSGYVAESGEPVPADYNVVRPALWVAY